MEYAPEEEVDDDPTYLIYDELQIIIIFHKFENITYLFRQIAKFFITPFPFFKF